MYVKALPNFTKEKVITLRTLTVSTKTYQEGQQKRDTMTILNPIKKKAKTITKTIKMGASKNTMTTSENICVKSNAVIIIAKKHTTKNNKKNIKRIMLTKSMRENLKRLPVIVVVSFHTDTKHSILEQRNTKTGSMNKMKNK